MQSDQREAQDRTRFLLKNLAKGLIWLIVIVGGYFFLRQNYNFTLEDLLGPLYHKPFWMFSIFFLSEVIFGIIPPELFMLWSLRDEILLDYVGHIALLAGLSYSAGIMGHYIGAHFSTTPLYRSLRKNYLGQFEKHINRYGGFLIIVAALTPLPFSAICMLMGATKYPMKRFLSMSLTRVLRFAVYAAIVWKANVLS